MERFDLNGQWEFKGMRTRTNGVTAPADVYHWMAATVPGTVHTDLLALAKIPDPFYRMKELDVQWVDKEQWLYRKEFEIGKAFMAHDAIHLVAEGLDTYATVKLNGNIAGTTADMFVPHRLDVKKLLRTGRNVLEIHFDSPTGRAQQLEARHGRLQVSHESPRAFVRKAQYSFGWDWGPKLTTSGIWRPIYLEAHSVCRIVSVFARTTHLTKKAADVRIDVELERWASKPVVLNVHLSGHSFEWQKTYAVKSAKTSVVLRIPNPKLWWPNGYGEQNLYEVKVVAEAAGSECDRRNTKFGIRAVRLIQEKDKEGKSFVIEMNGVKVYCKGADWIPSDNFIPRIPDSTYEKLLTMAHDAHMNMVRVWGGGIYEQEMFYELCDRLGLMVWQDFMFACSEYPEDTWFLRQVRDEAEKAVVRLRNHPSVVLWCGNNECEWIFCRENPGKAPDDMSGSVIFRNVLPETVRRLDGTRPYWRSSPYGSGFPNAESDGNHHEWEVWGLWKDYRDYEKVFARFVTEFGFQAPASVKTMEAVTVPADRYPQSRVLEHHNKLPEGTERLYRFQASHLPVAGTYEDFVYKGQIIQAEALRTATEHWRRRKFRTAGSMFWQLNDCWPVTSWSVIDSALRPKAAWFAAKRFYAPVLVSFCEKADTVEVWVTNDRLFPIEGDLHIRILTFTGKEVWSAPKQIRVGANSSGVYLVIPGSHLGDANLAQTYVYASCTERGQTVSENRHFFVEMKHAELQPAELSVDLVQKGTDAFTATVRSKALARFVVLDVKGEDVTPDDNYFDVDPGSTKSVTLYSQTPLEELRKKLKIHSLGG